MIKKTYLYALITSILLLISIVTTCRQIGNDRRYDGLNAISYEIERG